MNGNKTAWSEIVLCAVFVIPVIWLALIVAQSLGGDISEFVNRFTEHLSNPFDVHWTEQSMKCVLIFLGVYVLGIILYYSTRPKLRVGEEHGSAQWGVARQINKLFSQKNNILLTKNVKLGLDSYKHKRNLNVLVIGGSGSGKTRFFALPNIMQGNTSFVITDPKSEILHSTGHLLEKKGYTIKVLDLINFQNSNGYNPFRYIRDDKDVIKLITNLIRNTTPKGATQSEPFWEKSEIALLQAIMFYLIYEAPPSEQNFSMVMTMLEYADVREEDETYTSPLDMLFDSLEREFPEHVAVKQYKVFKQAAGKTAKSILISVAVRLAAFNLSQMRDITNHDEMDIGCLGEKKVALFACIPDNDVTFNFLVGLLYTQVFQELYYRADRIHGGRLPVPVHMILDEFPNTSIPEEFDKCLATMRSRGISASIIIQNLAQLKGLFKNNAHETIIGNCDSLLYLGGNEFSTFKYISDLLGKSTIDTRTHGQTKGRSGSYSTNYQISGRELLTPDEVRLLDNEDALLFIRGTRPVIDRKYNLMKHPNIKYTSQGGYPTYERMTINQGMPFTKVVDFKRLQDYEIYEESDNT